MTETARYWIYLIHTAFVQKLTSKNLFKRIMQVYVQNSSQIYTVTNVVIAHRESEGDI